MKKLLLFDIDGTLLNTGGAGKRSMVRAFEEVYGVPDGFHGIHMSGKTDPMILREALLQAKLPLEEDLADLFKQRYFELMAIEIEKPNPKKVLMPGIRELIEHLSERPDVVLGLLTGNWKQGAALKLGHFRLHHYFKLGAYGDDSIDREKLLPFATERFERYFNDPIPPENILVIGDTPRDIQCAKPHGARTVGVATGTYSVDQLQNEQPDFIFEDFSDWMSFVEILK
ncbi:MAG: HAD family hydrolase [Calditrichaeota bacterium]|nr:HAD family hydrolase [Calditrichota bacterium]